MTKTQMMRFKAALEVKRQELVRAIRAQTGELAIREGGHDPIDQVQSMNQRDEAALTVQWLSRVLSDVDAALRAMSEGVYGACVNAASRLASNGWRRYPGHRTVSAAKSSSSGARPRKRPTVLGRCALASNGRLHEHAAQQSDDC